MAHGFRAPEGDRDVLSTVGVVVPLIRKGGAHLDAVEQSLGVGQIDGREAIAWGTVCLLVVEEPSSHRHHR